MGGVDKFEPASDGDAVDDAEEAVDHLVAASGDATAYPELPKHVLDAVARLVERTAMPDLHPTIWAIGNDGLDRPIGKRELGIPFLFR